MFELFLLPQIQAERALAEILSPLLPAAFWYHLEARYGNHDLELCFISRDHGWLTREFPGHFARANRIAHAILRDPDEASEAVATALWRIERVPYLPDDFGSYLDKAVRNAARDITRRRWVSREVSLEDLVCYYDLCDDSPNPEDELLQAEYVQIVHEAISELGSMERRAVELHYLDELTISQTAYSLGVSTPRAQNVLVRARMNLARLLIPRLFRKKNQRRATSCGY